MKKYIYITIIVLLIVGLIVFIVLTEEDKKNLIKVSECHKPKGEFAVEAGFTVEESNILQTCGSNGTSVCSFAAQNLSNATNICNANPSKCERFIFNSSLKSMSFVNNTPSFKKNNSVDIYVRQ